MNNKCVKCGKPAGYNPAKGKERKICVACLEKIIEEGRAKKQEKIKRIENTVNESIYLEKDAEGAILIFKIEDVVERLRINSSSTVSKYQKDEPQRSLNLVTINHKEGRNTLLCPNTTYQSVTYNRLVELLQEVQ